VTPRPQGIADLEDLDCVFAALAHQSRRTILSVLHARGGEMTSGDIASRFDCSWPTTTRHLRILEESGLVQVALRGRERIYALQTARLQSIAGEWINCFRGAAMGADGGAKIPEPA
jgi:DNA-binding transcriptional ArsR family regulator